MHLLITDFYSYKTGKLIVHDEPVESVKQAVEKYDAWTAKFPKGVYSIVVADKLADQMLVVADNYTKTVDLAYANKTEEQWIEDELVRCPSRYAPSSYDKQIHVEAIKKRFGFSMIVL